MPTVDFQRLPHIEPSQKYLEFALSKTQKRISQLSVKGDGVARVRKKEVERIIMVRDALLKYLQKIHAAWPSLDMLPEFYQKLIDHTLDRDMLKQSLAALNNSQQTLKTLSKEFIGRVQRQQEIPAIKRQISQYLGRVSSVFSRNAKKLEYLEQARKVMRNYPALDPELFTVAIAGFPNVGKSTLLSKLTTASPEIQNYAFTTKGLNVGLFEHKFSRVQLVDTPGTLARTNENDIEYLATITRRYAARLVVYVYDITEPYPLENQERLRTIIEEEGHEMIVYLSKADILPKKKVEAFKKDHPDVFINPKAIRSAITKKFDEWV